MKQSGTLRTAAAAGGALAILLAAGPAAGQAQELWLQAPASGAWESSPYRNFLPPQTLLAGRVVLSDEGSGRTLPAALSAELKRLSVELFEKQGWRSPFADRDPLRILVARKEAGGVRRLSLRGIGNRRLEQPAIQIDATGLSDAEIAAEVGRLFAQAVLTAYDVPDSTFFTAAAAAYIADLPESESEREATRAAAAAPELDLNRAPIAMGRLFVEELGRAAGGPVVLRAAWELARETGEQILPVALRTAAEASGERAEAIALRFAARLYASVESETAPSRIGMDDLLTGAFDAAAHAPLSIRHRTFLPGESAAALRVAWPAEAGLAAAVVRYRDGQIPPDVVFLEPGQTRTIPSSGVERVDWVVQGGTATAPAAPVFFEAAGEFPYSGLSATADSAGDGARLMWTTASHEGLAGWAVFREQLLADGRVTRTGPQIVPASSRGEESLRYAYIDATAAAGAWYRYTVWAVTDDGLLARAFSTTLKAAD